VNGPLESTAGTPTGVRQYWEMTDGALTGARINAKVAMPGGDWMVVGRTAIGARTCEYNSSPTTARWSCCTTPG
jgi:hypothetical protein